MNWALVEMELNMFFHALHGGEYEAADMMWSTVRSFDLKLQMMNKLVVISDLPKKIKERWRLLFEHIPSQYRSRNMVAHSTPIDMSGKMCVLPFMSLFGRNTKAIDAAQIEEFGMDFLHLREALVTINPGITKSGRRRPRLKAQEHDLIIHLRNKDDQKREAQRHRALAWRQYLETHPELKA
jgi:hypothetical protein